MTPKQISPFVLIRNFNTIIKVIFNDPKIINLRRCHHQNQHQIIVGFKGEIVSSSFSSQVHHHRRHQSPYNYHPILKRSYLCGF